MLFDGYGTSSTKDMAHCRRAKGKKGPTVSFTKEMNLTVAKDLFLSDQTNKQQFIEYLAQVWNQQVAKFVMPLQMPMF